jgi:hypothetical protein
MSDKQVAKGRPCLYNEAMQAAADAYIHDYANYGDVVPQIAGLACYLGIHRDTVQDWVKKYPSFSVTVSTIKVMQERLLINGSLSDKLNTKTSLMLLSANHGITEKSKIVTDDGQGNDAPLNTTPEITINNHFHSPDGSDND